MMVQAEGVMAMEVGAMAMVAVLASESVVAVGERSSALLLLVQMHLHLRVEALRLMSGMQQVEVPLAARKEMWEA